MELQSAKNWSLRQLFTNSLTNLPPLGQIDVGRAKSSNLYIGVASLSSRHAAFVVNCYGNLLLRDLHSNTGTFVNKQLLPSCKNKLLAHGDIVSFGVAHYDEHSMPKEMKECFFEVIADDRASGMGMVEDLTATVANNGKPIRSDDNEDGKAKSGIENIDPKPKEKKKVHPLMLSKEGKQCSTQPMKSDGVFKKPANGFTASKRNNNTVPSFIPSGTNVAIKNTIKLSKSNIAIESEKDTVDSIKQKYAEGKNKGQPIKPTKEGNNLTRSLDLSKKLAQGSTVSKGKNTVQPLKTFDELLTMRGKKKSANANKLGEIPPNQPSDMIYHQQSSGLKDHLLKTTMDQPTKSSCKGLVQGSTVLRRKNTVQPLKTFDELMNIKDKEKLPSKPQIKKPSSDDLKLTKHKPAEKQPQPAFHKSLDSIKDDLVAKITNQDFKNFAHTKKLVMSIGGKTSSNFDNLDANARSILKKNSAQTNPNKHQLEMDQDGKKRFHAEKKMETGVASS
ncbi:unnamed protein product [Ceutorhynchus assimilis]|uniref:FHA domain-containing protein n=1 Tax=Ceutorhynchus assimilis TaxID=467358 RepID=A0A9N9MTZ0_9CUCU|nr:unnamed protein product [Ceutorhynchus assimilis]